MPKHLLLTLIAAALASGLFLAVLASGLGFIFMFLPTLPLFVIGLGKQPRLALIAALIASALIGLAAGPSIAILFIVFFGLPSWYLANHSLLWRSDGTGRQWMPVGTILTQLTLYACATVALITLFYASQPGGLPQLLSQNIHEAFSDLQGDYGDVIDMLAGRLSFLVFSIAVWLWGLALYAHAWLANRLLSAKGHNLRPNFAIDVFHMPGWMLTLLAICALASLIGSPSMSFLGKSTLISLMLPYFFQGAALMHAVCRTWLNRRFFLFFVYFMMFALFWPALILSGVGLWHQIKHLSADKTSSKS